MKENELLASIGYAPTVAEPSSPVEETFHETQFQDYVIEARLGEGSYGKVYRAHHVDNPDVPLALKVVQTHGRYEDMLREPTLLSTLHHPGIVRVHDFFPIANQQQLVLAMEYVAGGDLKQAIDETHTFPPAVVQDFLIQLASALVNVHQQGIVHRDLKPANILLDRTGPQVRYVLTDFGVGMRQEGLRHEKNLAGTYLYMAPEQLRGRPVAESDLWSLGVIAYKMLTGQYPFPGPTPVQLMNQIQLTTPAQPSEVLGTPIDHQLERAILKLLDRSETERLGSAEALLNLLGVKDTSGATTTHTISRTRLQQRVESLDATLQKGIRRNFFWMWVWIAFMLLNAGLFSGTITALAMAVVFHAHARARTRLWHYGELVLAGLLLLGHTMLPVYLPQFLARSSLAGVLMWVAPHIPGAGEIVIVAFLILGLLGWLIPIWACSRFAQANQLKRDRLLLYSSSKDEHSSEHYLHMLKTAVDYRAEDVNLHLKYAEALAARGDDQGAAVEARLLLDTDPYHFVGNLLLAQCYHRLRLYHDCSQVCAEYLAVAGYSFEFAELKELCRQQLQGVHS